MPPKPTITLNGTSPTVLLDQINAVRRLLLQVEEAMKEAAPHPRDYPHSPEVGQREWVNARDWGIVQAGTIHRLLGEWHDYAFYVSERLP